MKTRIHILLIAILLFSCRKEDSYDPYLAEIEKEVLFLVNGHRASIGMEPLKNEEVMTYEARKHSTAMASGEVPFGHDGFSERVAEIKKTFPAGPAAENVGWNNGDAESMVELWLSSPGHKANIEGSYTRTGIGVARSANGQTYYTQIFYK